jgi:hypothetical protein
MSRRIVVMATMLVVAVFAALLAGIGTSLSNDRHWSIPARSIPVEFKSRCAGNGTERDAGDAWGLSLATTPIAARGALYTFVNWCAAQGKITAITVRLKLGRDDGAPTGFPAPRAAESRGISLRYLDGTTPLHPSLDAPDWEGKLGSARYAWLVTKRGCPGCRMIYTLDLTATAATISARRAS